MTIHASKLSTSKKYNKEVFLHYVRSKIRSCIQNQATI